MCRVGEEKMVKIIVNCSLLTGLSQCLENSVRFCTVGPAETQKCRDMKEQFASASLSKVISCYEAADHVECMQLIKGIFS